MKQFPTLLLIEDETNVRQSLTEYLTKEGFRVQSATTSKEADRKITENPDIVILDWMLPDGQGIELLKAWRKKGIDIPTLLLTARAELVDKVLGLELGANDYMTKPFEPRELVARIRVQLRQKNKSENLQIYKAAIESSGLSLNPTTRECSYLGNPLELTKTEFALLQILLENPNQVFSREELLKRVWGYNQYPTTRTVDTHILQLRQKTNSDLFETLHKIGYRFRPIKP